MLTLLENMFVKKEMPISEQRERYGMLSAIWYFTILRLGTKSILLH